MNQSIMFRKILLRFFCFKDVVEKTKLSQSTIYRLIEEGKFPKGGNYYGSRMRFWTDQEISEWILGNLHQEEQ